MVAEEEDLTVVERARLRGAKAVLLNSRQGKRPCGKDGWVQATERAVAALINRNVVIVTSVGLNTWELVLHAVNVAGGRQLVILPPAEDRERASELVVADFRLDRSRTEFHFLTTTTQQGTRSGKWWWPERDRLAIEPADLLLPISLRPQSKLAELLADAESSGKTVARDFQTKYQPGGDKVEYDFASARFNPRFSPGWDYVTHWTRSSHGPLPGESSFEYYQDLLASSRYPRSALDVLGRIASEQRLRASNRFLRAGVSAVAFTSQNPLDAVGLMRWRRRYVYYNFEPYGIAIHREVARELGLRPVIYGTVERLRQLTPEERPFFQNQGSKTADWLPEFELRHLGDLDLSALPAGAIKLIVYREEDRARLPDSMPYEVMPLTV